MPAMNSTPVRAFSWKNTCPTPANTRPEDAEPVSVANANARRCSHADRDRWYRTDAVDDEITQSIPGHLRDARRGRRNGLIYPRIARTRPGCVDQSSHVDSARSEFVDAADDLQFARLHESRYDRIEGLQPFDARSDVGLDGVLELIPGFTPDGGGGRPDELHQIANRAGQGVVGVDMLHGGLDGSARAVAEDHEQPHAQLGDGELDAPLHGRAAPLTRFPATRTTKRSPTPWSKTSSGDTRESAHPMMAAIGA